MWRTRIPLNQHVWHSFGNLALIWQFGNYLIIWQLYGNLRLLLLVWHSFGQKMSLIFRLITMESRIPNIQKMEPFGLQTTGSLLLKPYLE